MERRSQEVIDHYWQLGDANPILFIHDVGGRSSNAMPELVSDGGRSGKFELHNSKRRTGHEPAGNVV
ncbi:hypothetical protein ACLK19_17040 [Escherichia coli]